MDIQEWADRIMKATDKRFPDRLSLKDKVLSLTSQVGNLAEKVQVLDGTRKKDKRPNEPIQETAVSVLIDILIICKMLETDFDIELSKGEKWFLEG